MDIGLVHVVCGINTRFIVWKLSLTWGLILTAYKWVTDIPNSLSWTFVVCIYWIIQFFRHFLVTGMNTYICKISFKWSKIVGFIQSITFHWIKYHLSESGVPQNSVPFGGTVLMNNVSFGGTVPPNSVLFFPFLFLLRGRVMAALKICRHSLWYRILKDDH